MDLPMNGPMRFPGPDSLDELGVQKDPSLLKTDYLNAHHILFELDKTTTVPAFMALASVFFGELEEMEDLAPTDLLEVPVWVIQSITIGFMNYRDAILRGESLRLGEAMGLESEGKGVKPRLVKEQRRLRDLKLTMFVALRVDAGELTKDAVKAAAEEYLVSQSTAMRIWSKNKSFVRECLNNFRLSSPR